MGGEARPVKTRHYETNRRVFFYKDTTVFGWGVNTNGEPVIVIRVPWSLAGRVMLKTVTDTNRHTAMERNRSKILCTFTWLDK